MPTIICNSNSSTLVCEEIYGHLNVRVFHTITMSLALNGAISGDELFFAIENRGSALIVNGSSGLPLEVGLKR